MGKYLLAHDLGTSGNKATLFSTEEANSSLVAHIIMMFITKEMRSVKLLNLFMGI